MTAADDLVARAEQIGVDARAACDATTTVAELDEVERQFLGKSSPLNEIREAIKSVDGPDRSRVGKALSKVRTELEARLGAQR